MRWPILIFLLILCSCGSKDPSQGTDSNTLQAPPVNTEELNLLVNQSEKICDLYRDDKSFGQSIDEKSELLDDVLTNYKNREASQLTHEEDKLQFIIDLMNLSWIDDSILTKEEIKNWSKKILVSGDAIRNDLNHLCLAKLENEIHYFSLEDKLFTNFNLQLFANKEIARLRSHGIKIFRFHFLTLLNQLLAYADDYRSGSPLNKNDAFVAMKKAEMLVKEKGIIVSKSFKTQALASLELFGKDLTKVSEDYSPNIGPIYHFAFHESSKALHLLKVEVMYE